MEMTVLAVAGLLLSGPVAEVQGSPNCEDDDDSTPCCPIEDRSNIGVLDAWLDCAYLSEDGVTGARHA